MDTPLLGVSQELSHSACPSVSMDAPLLNASQELSHGACPSVSVDAPLLNISQELSHGACPSMSVDAPLLGISQEQSHSACASVSVDAPLLNVSQELSHGACQAPPSLIGLQGTCAAEVPARASFPWPGQTPSCHISTARSWLVHTGWVHSSTTMDVECVGVCLSTVCRSWGHPGASRLAQ